LPNGWNTVFPQRRDRESRVEVVNIEVNHDDFSVAVVHGWDRLPARQNCAGLYRSQAFSDHDPIAAHIERARRGIAVGAENHNRDRPEDGDRAKGDDSAHQIAVALLKFLVLFTQHPGFFARFFATRV